MILSIDDFFNKDVFCYNDDSRSMSGLSVVLFSVCRRINGGYVERRATLERVVGPTRNRAVELKIHTRVDDQVPRGQARIR